MKYIAFVRQLMLPFASLIVVLLLAAGWLYEHMAMVNAVTQQQQQVQIELNTINRKIAQSAQDKLWIAQYLQAYRGLQRDGFIGGDQRMAWQQMLIVTGDRLGLHGVNFDIAPQQPHRPELQIGALNLMDTPVQFTADMPHEGVFAQLLDDLRTQKHGVMTVRECTLSHAVESAPVQMRCILVWHNLTPRAAS
ncbi:MAG: hypothetical protein P4L77_00340 [Sulfuriferula sp.]|nr:hypothetical protein [Sulfuriferula sp.]